MSDINLEAAQLIVKGANSKGGLGWLEWYSGHRVYHPGIDINKDYGNSDLGLPINCPLSGIVTFVAQKPTRWNKYNNGFGLHCVIYHANKNVWTHYVHLGKCNLKKDELTYQGQEIATIGKSGTTYAHLHFSVWTQKLHDNYQINRGWRKNDYEFYPSGWAKHTVQDYYKNPNNFLIECSGKAIAEPDWLKKKIYPPKENKFIIPSDWGDDFEEAKIWNKRDKIAKLDTEQKCINLLMIYRAIQRTS